MKYFTPKSLFSAKNQHKRGKIAKDCKVFDPLHSNSVRTALIKCSGTASFSSINIGCGSRMSNFRPIYQPVLYNRLISSGL